LGFFIVKILKLYYNNVIEIQLKEIEMIYFRKAGKKITGSNETVFFTSESRIRSLNETIFHRNDFNSEWRIPDEFFKKHFKYEHSSQIYRTILTYKEIEQFLEVQDLKKLVA
jgi:hypothetical protein